MAVHQAAMRRGQERRGQGQRDQRQGLGRLARLARLVRWPLRWPPLLGQPAPLVGYVVTVVASYLTLTGWEMHRTRPRTSELLLFAALLTCGGLCIEATRRLGMPAGVSRDLLSAWWLPVALLLPPVYALIAPVPLNVLLQLRVRRTAIYRRVFSVAALGLAAAVASILFGRFGLPAGAVRSHAPWSASAGPRLWFTHPVTVLIAVGCAGLFSVLNAALVAIAAHASEPQIRWRDVLWDAEKLILDVTEICVGVLVTIACSLSPLLLFMALPPVILLQRSLLHQQLRAAARTDAKTGLLNLVAWQREADTEIGRVLRTGESLAVLLVDIDHFKRVNDTHGHLVGDQVLAALADALRQQVRESDLVGRFGGEEFVVLLPGADAVEAAKVAERLRENARAMLTAVGDTEIAVTVSIGAAVLGQHGGDVRGLLISADRALYQAKAAGRDRVCLPGPRPSPDPDPATPVIETIARAYEMGC
jgi:diguanylate cyclase (GGDEF)-like protein